MFTLSSIQPHTRIQVHVVKSHAASNLNRDDLGRPKEVSMGGRLRLRISSQSIKRALRMGDVFNAFRKSVGQSYGAVPMIRTTQIERIVAGALEAKGFPTDKALEGAKAVSALLSKEKPEEEAKPKAGKGKDEAGEEAAAAKAESSQLLAISQAEVDAIVEHLAAIEDKSSKDWAKKAMKSMVDMKARERRFFRGDLSPEMQLFGRMVTSDAFSNVDAAVQVAHAFTVHEARSERDYWTGVDDFKAANGEAGSGMIDVRRFGAGVFYQYASIDVDLLVQNLAGSHLTLSETEVKELARDVINAFLFAFAGQNPTGYQNSFASHALPEFMAIEVGGTFPHSAAAAYETPVKAESNGGYVEPARAKFIEWLTKREAKFGDCFGDVLTVGLRDGDSQFESAIIAASSKALNLA